MPQLTTHAVYLHGFASSPGGRKAETLREYLEPMGVNYTVPDLNVPDFEHLTLTAQIEKIAATIQALPEGPVYPIGSSLGGLALAHFMERHRESEARRVTGMVLLAPAFDLVARWRERFGADALARWQQNGHVMIEHYAYEGQLPLHYGFIEDVAQYEDRMPSLDVPVQIFHGRHDESVDYRESVKVAERHPNATLHLLDSDHSLIDAMPFIQQEIAQFMGLSR